MDDEEWIEFVVAHTKQGGHFLRLLHTGASDTPHYFSDHVWAKIISFGCIRSQCNAIHTCQYNTDLLITKHLLQGYFTREDNTTTNDTIIVGTNEVDGFS